MHLKIRVSGREADIHIERQTARGRGREIGSERDGESDALVTILSAAGAWATQNGQFPAAELQLIS